ncbi:CDK2-associated and cullin domain-containing protein 1 isoform X1 [Erpetoichthys calabaricus]|uniref:CDK2-associated and cullin domain-containing protein 1 isoform X1 n=1 Tax=Erpetoichthys calabaricus TaxID=27687 RepID=UPI0022340B80|nr:CDK2-associated and cullin domain-containing protein 1 isoform X1 [Erpetoichthys calabaricus]
MDDVMEEDGSFDMMDDHNHNNWEAKADAYGGQAPPPGEPNAVGRSSGVPESESSGASAGRAALNINSSASKFLMNVISREEYQSTYWPKLESAIEQLLTQSPKDYIPISYEQIYSCVYKCVCQQHSEQMYTDLIGKITRHLQHVSEELKSSPPEHYIEKFNTALTQYMGALQSIVPLFIYMNKFYIETKLNRDLREDLIKLFTDCVAEKHVCTLMPLLLQAHSTPFQITPSTMASIIKGLYALRPDWVQLAPALFSNFIPNILPPAMESQLCEYAAQDQKFQRDLVQNGFSRGDQSRKRAGEELTYSGASLSSATSRGYR